MTSLTFLNSVSDRVALALSLALKSNTKLTTLNFECGVSDAVGVAIDVYLTQGGSAVGWMVAQTLEGTFSSV